MTTVTFGDTARDATLLGSMVSGDDKMAYRSGAVYPATGAITHFTTDANLTVWRALLGNYNQSNILIKWNTASLPDTANITSATLRTYVISKANADSLSIAMDWRVLDGTSSDFSHAPLTTAHSGTAISAITASQTYDFALTNLSNISKTGYTGVRLHVTERASDAAPTGNNNIVIASVDNTIQVEPQLIVTYTLGSDSVGWIGI